MPMSGPCAAGVAARAGEPQSTAAIAAARIHRVRCMGSPRQCRESGTAVADAPACHRAARRACGVAGWRRSFLLFEPVVEAGAAEFGGALRLEVPAVAESVAQGDHLAGLEQAHAVAEVEPRREVLAHGEG